MARGGGLQAHLGQARLGREFCPDRPAQRRGLARALVLVVESAGTVAGRAQPVQARHVAQAQHGLRLEEEEEVVLEM